MPLLVANTIIGSWDRSFGGARNLSSQLAVAVNEGKLASAYMSFNTVYTDTSLWGTYFVCDRLCIDDFLYNLQKAWRGLCTSVSEVRGGRGVAVCACV